MTRTLSHVAMLAAVVLPACDGRSPEAPRVVRPAEPVEQLGVAPGSPLPPWAECRLEDGGAADPTSLSHEVLAHLTNDAPAAALDHLIPGGCQYFAGLFDSVNTERLDAEFRKYRDLTRTLEPRVRASRVVLEGLPPGGPPPVITTDPGETAGSERVSIALGAGPDPWLVRFDISHIAGRVFLASPPIAVRPIGARFADLEVAFTNLGKVIGEPRPVGALLEVSRAVGALSDDPDPAVRERLVGAIATFRSSIPAGLDARTAAQLAVALALPPSLSPSGSAWSGSARPPEPGEAPTGSARPHDFVQAPSDSAQPHDFVQAPSDPAPPHDFVQAPSDPAPPPDLVTTLAGPAADGERPDPYTALVTRVSGDGEYVLKRSALAEILEDRDKLMRDARVVPDYEDDKLRGFKLIGLRPGSFYRRVGIVSGDVILADDGVPLTNENALGAFLTRFEAGKDFELAIERRGQPKTLSYRFE